MTDTNDTDENESTDNHPLPGPLSSDVYDELREAAASPQEEVIVDFCCGLGLRASELTNLQPSWFDADDQVITVESTMPPSAGCRKIPLSDDMADEMVQVFAMLETESLDMSSGYVRDLLRKVGRRAGFDDVTPHSVRRNLASKLYVSGVPRNVVARMMGHQTMTVAFQSCSASDDEEVVSVESSSHLKESISRYLRQRDGTLSAASKNREQAVLMAFAEWCEETIGENPNEDWPVQYNKMRSRYLGHCGLDVGEPAFRSIAQILDNLNEAWKSTLYNS